MIPLLLLILTGLLLLGSAFFAWQALRRIWQAEEMPSFPKISNVLFAFFVFFCAGLLVVAVGLLAGMGLHKLLHGYVHYSIGSGEGGLILMLVGVLGLGFVWAYIAMALLCLRRWKNSDRLVAKSSREVPKGLFGKKGTRPYAELERKTYVLFYIFYVLSMFLYVGGILL